MAINTTVALASRVWTQLTNTDATAITFVCEGPYAVVIKGTVGAVAPTDTLGGITYRPGEGETNIPLSDLWPGIVATRVYAYAASPTEVMVSHA